MSKLKPPQPVKLVMSLLSPERQIINAAIGKLAEVFGEADIISNFLEFPYTDYYAHEMGGKLVRRMISFTDLISPDSLPVVKVSTTDMEEAWAKEGKRVVNIDPGYLALPHLILATGKGYTHRPYLGRGVYADLTLIYQGGNFCPLPWTYPDYRSSEMLGFLCKVRTKYVRQLRATRELI